MLEKVLGFVEKFQILILGLLFAFVLFGVAHIIVSALPNDGITVTGSASKIVQSDNGVLDFNINAREATRKLSHAKVQAQIPVVKKYLISKGIAEKDINIKTPHGYMSYKMLYNGNSSNEPDHYNYYQPVSVKSNDVNKIKDLSLDIANLMNQGIDIDVSAPEYYYSKLSDLKIDLLKEATTDAKQRASAMLKSTHNRTGKIQSVRMGVFQITDANSTDVSDGGIYDTSSIEKKVTAVANVIFKIK